MEDTRNDALNELFDVLAEELNISKTMEEKAVSGYRSVGSWLDGDERIPSSEIYAQGSFNLGTVIRPLCGEDSDYDIDLVYHMPSMAYADASMIKKIPGERLKEHGTYAGKLEPEGKRCWTLDYDGFHMDILPCTTDVSSSSETAIRLTHREDWGWYSDRYSDPKEYAKWFEGRMGDVLYAAKKRYASKVFCSVEEVQTYQVRTPLQKAIQILKHHRNLMFDGKDNAPISIIITTLAAWAYKGESGTYDCVRRILDDMDSLIELRGGEYWIPSPVDSSENFADKWNENPDKVRAFFRWLYQARSDIEVLEQSNGMVALGGALAAFAGEIMSKRTLEKHSRSLKNARESRALFASAAGVTKCRTDGSVRVKDHAFYGF